MDSKCKRQKIDLDPIETFWDPESKRISEIPLSEEQKLIVEKIKSKNNEVLAFILAMHELETQVANDGALPLVASFTGITLGLFGSTLSRKLGENGNLEAIKYLYTKDQLKVHEAQAGALNSGTKKAIQVLDYFFKKGEKQSWDTLVSAITRQQTDVVRWALEIGFRPTQYDVEYARGSFKLTVGDDVAKKDIMELLEESLKNGEVTPKALVRAAVLKTM